LRNDVDFQYLRSSFRCQAGEAGLNNGILLAADGLKASSQGKRIVFDGPSRTVIDGPFTETRGLVAGFWLWEVKDMDEAVAWVKRWPTPCQDRARSKSGRCKRWLICDENLTPEITEIHDRTVRRNSEPFGNGFSVCDLPHTRYISLILLARPRGIEPLFSP
jgi:YCII-related domain